MTQEEFYLKAMLALASNPNYVQVDTSDEDPNFTSHILLTEEIQMDADRLLKEAQTSWIDAFDKGSESANEHLRTIAEAVSDLNMSGITTYPQEP